MDIVVHSIDGCYYCDRTKIFLDSINKPYSVINYTRDDTHKIIEVTKYKKFPQIFINGEFIGGYTDMVEKICKF